MTRHLVIAGLLVALVVASAVSVFLGAREIPVAAVLDGSLDETGWRVIRELRLPRIAAAVIAGAGLAAAGVISQTLLDNRLADPGLIGVNAGAGLAGVSVLSLMGFNAPVLVTACVAGSLAVAVLITLLANRPRTAMSPERVIIAGMAISAVLGGVATLVTFSNPLRFAALRTWLLGTLSGRDWSMVAAAAPAILLALVVALALAPELDALRAGRSKATTVGVRPTLVPLVAVILIAALAGAAVSLVGALAFLGLAVPHIARRITTGGHARTLVVAALVGATLLVVTDIVARSLFAPVEVPVALLVALLGAPFFLHAAITHGRASETGFLRG